MLLFGIILNVNIQNILFLFFFLGNTRSQLILMLAGFSDYGKILQEDIISDSYFKKLNKFPNVNKSFLE